MDRSMALAKLKEFRATLGAERQALLKRSRELAPRKTQQQEIEQAIRWMRHGIARCEQSLNMGSLRLPLPGESLAKWYLEHGRGVNTLYDLAQYHNRLEGHQAALQSVVALLEEQERINARLEEIREQEAALKAELLPYLNS